MFGIVRCSCACDWFCCLCFVVMFRLGLAWICVLFVFVVRGLLLYVFCCLCLLACDVKWLRFVGVH